jgi:hypothetical protein
MYSASVKVVFGRRESRFSHRKLFRNSRMPDFRTTLFGKVFETRNGLHIATRFFEVNSIPLVPLESFIVVRDTSAGFRGTPIKLHFASVMIAYVRLLLVCVSFVGIFGLIVHLGRDDHTPAHKLRTADILLCVGGAALVSFFATYHLPFLATASPAKEAWMTARVTNAGTRWYR